MDVIKFERRHKKKKIDGSTQPAFTPKQLDFPWFKKTYRRRKKENGGGDRRKRTGGSDGLHLLATAAADESFGGQKARSTSLSAGQVGNLSVKGVPTPPNNGDNKMHHVHHQEANAENIVLRERNGFLESGKWVDQLLDGSHQLLHQEQSDTCGSVKAYTFGEHVMEDDAGKFLICHGCNAAYHLHCLPSKVKDMPSGNWYCTSCIAAVKESREPKPADVQSGDECACNHDPCAPCERLDHLVPPRTHGQGEYHCVVCRKLCKLRRPKHRQIKHHCFVCKRLYKLILAKHMHMQAKRKRSEAAATMPKTNAKDLDCHEDGQKSGVCKVCGTGKEGDEGIATCSNTYCESMHYHISCLKPPLKEVPPPGWYCHSCLCRACLVDENDDRIVICDGCDDGYHTYCMNPSLLRIPRGKWYCRSCQERKAQPKIQPLPGS